MKYEVVGEPWRAVPRLRQKRRRPCCESSGPMSATPGRSTAAAGRGLSRRGIALCDRLPAGASRRFRTLAVDHRWGPPSMPSAVQGRLRPRPERGPCPWPPRLPSRTSKCSSSPNRQLLRPCAAGRGGARSVRPRLGNLPVERTLWTIASPSTLQAAITGGGQNPPPVADGSLAGSVAAQWQRFVAEGQATVSQTASGPADVHPCWTVGPWKPRHGSRGWRARGVPGRLWTGRPLVPLGPVGVLVRSLAESFRRRPRAGMVAVALSQRGGAAHRAGRIGAAALSCCRQGSPSFDSHGCNTDGNTYEDNSSQLVPGAGGTNLSRHRRDRRLLWLRRVDESGAAALVQLPRPPVNKFPEFREPRRATAQDAVPGFRKKVSGTVISFAPLLPSFVLLAKRFLTPFPAAPRQHSPSRVTA